MVKRKRSSAPEPALSATDEMAYFNFSGPTRYHYRKSNVKNFQPVFIEANQKTDVDPFPQQLDFVVENVSNIIPGPQTRFVIQGLFEMKPPAAEGGAEQDWKVIPATEYVNVLVQPGWLDHLIRSVEVYYGNNRVCVHEENRNVTPHIASFMDALQDKEILKLSSPGAHHPGHYTMPMAKDKLELTWTKWRDYAPSIFTEDTQTYEYWPKQWPFVQHVNHLDSEEGNSVCRALPMELFGKLTVSVKMAPDPGCIFRKKTGNATKYRFAIRSFMLVVQEALLLPPLEKRLANKTGIFTWPGISRLTLVEAIPGGTPTYVTRFKEIHLPDGLLIFALDQNVANGTWTFANTNKKNGFLSHNLEHVELQFNNKSYSTKEPSMGQVTKDLLDHWRLLSHLQNPIFGLKPDKDAITLEHIREGGEESAFPHVYLPLTPLNGEPGVKILPTHDDGSSAYKEGTLELYLKFKHAGSRRDAVYIIIAYYSDTAICFDGKKKMFYSPHGVLQN